MEKSILAILLWRMTRRASGKEILLHYLLEAGGMISGEAGGREPHLSIRKEGFKKALLENWPL